VTTNLAYNSLVFRLFCDDLAGGYAELNAASPYVKCNICESQNATAADTCRSCRTSLAEARATVEHAKFVKFALRLFELDVSELSRDFQPRTFESTFDVFATGVIDSLDKIRTYVPEMAPVVAGMRFGADQKQRFCDEVAAICRREFQHEVSQLAIHHSRAKAYKGVLESHGQTDHASTAKNVGLGALAVINPLIGIPMMLGSLFSESKREEQIKRQRTEAHDEITKTCRSADEARDGMLRAIAAIAETTAAKYRQFIELLVRGLVESGIATRVDWKLMCEQQMKDTASGLREICSQAPFMREEFAGLDLDDDVRALLPEVA